MGNDTYLYIEQNFRGKWYCYEACELYYDADLDIMKYNSLFNKITWDNFIKLNPSELLYNYINYSDYDYGIWYLKISENLRLFISMEG